LTAPRDDGDNKTASPAGQGQARHGTGEHGSVITIEDFSEVPGRLRGAFLAVGNFDGVHLGHAHLIARLRAQADATDAAAVALTFDPHPVAFLRPGRAPAPLLWTARNAEMLQQAGATKVGLFKTGPWLLGLTAREFFDKVVLGQFAARGMVEGPNFYFGRDRKGDTTQLGAWCREAGLSFEVVAPSTVDGQLVSSSRVRTALAEGRAGEAARMLGRPHRIRGFVTHGAARGAGLGFPTANLDGIDTLIPGDGVYAMLALIDGQGPPIPTACHIGPNVTFGEQERKVEAHLIDFSGDLYGRTVHLDILEQIRPSRKFAGLDDLLPQIRDDVDKTRAICAGAMR
jgi:riboflavin kinase/FMN adenylyltransferase